MNIAKVEKANKRGIFFIFYLMQPQSSKLLSKINQSKLFVDFLQIIKSNPHYFGMIFRFELHLVLFFIDHQIKQIRLIVGNVIKNK